MRHLNIRVQAISILVIIVLLSCKDNSVSPIVVTNNFSVKIVVKDVNGNVVRGIRVSAYNSITASPLNKTNVISSTEKVQASSVLPFQLKYNSMVTLAIYELDQTLIQCPASNLLLNKGSYSYVLSFQSKSVGTRVYKCILTADTANAIAFRDSVYMTLWQSDPDLSVLGYTSNTGTFESTDSLAFPNILNLPPMVKTYQTGPDSVGTFSIPSNVVFILTDTSILRSVSYTRQVIKGKNEFDLLWTPSSSSLNIFKNQEMTKSASSDTEIVVTIPSDWKLYQNYPNPFN